MTQAAPAVDVKAASVCPSCGSSAFSSSNHGKTCNACGEHFDVRPDPLNTARVPVKQPTGEGKHGITYANGQPLDFGAKSLHSTR